MSYLESHWVYTEPIRWTVQTIPGPREVDAYADCVAQSLRIDACNNLVFTTMDKLIQIIPYGQWLNVWPDDEGTPRGRPADL